MDRLITFKAALLACLLAASSFTYASESHISLKKAMADRLVTVTGMSNGGYCGKCIRMCIKNNTSREFSVDADPGLIFKPDDQKYQPLVLLGNESIELCPKTSTEANLQTFCGNINAESPEPHVRYRFWKQADNKLVSTLGYAKKNNVNMDIVQQAVWAFTNGESLSYVYDNSNFRMSESFAGYIAGITGQQGPEYYTQMKATARHGQPLARTSDGKTYVNMHWGNQGYRQMYVVICKENGDFYKKADPDEVSDKYGHTIKVTFDSKRDPPGTYLVQLHDENNRIWDQKKVVVSAAKLGAELN